eukprot:836216-Rhodomonas_salina.1
MGAKAMNHQPRVVLTSVKRDAAFHPPLLHARSHVRTSVLVGASLMEVLRLRHACSNQLVEKELVRSSWFASESLGVQMMWCASSPDLCVSAACLEPSGSVRSSVCLRGACVLWVFVSVLMLVLTLVGRWAPHRAQQPSSEAFSQGWWSGWWWCWPCRKCVWR